jgi:hypothetical protein
MASLEGQFSVYNELIKKKDGQIDSLWEQKTKLEDPEKKKEFEERIQKLEDEKKELMDKLTKLENALLGAFGRISIHTHSQRTRCFHFLAHCTNCSSITNHAMLVM